MFTLTQNLFEKNLRRAVMRYVNLSTILTLRLITNRVRERFPNYKAFENAKLLRPSEVCISYGIFCLSKCKI